MYQAEIPWCVTASGTAGSYFSGKGCLIGLRVYPPSDEHLMAVGKRTAQLLVGQARDPAFDSLGATQLAVEAGLVTACWSCHCLLVLSPLLWSASTCSRSQSDSHDLESFIWDLRAIDCVSLVD